MFLKKHIAKKNTFKKFYRKSNWHISRTEDRPIAVFSDTETDDEQERKLVQEELKKASFRYESSK